MAFTFIIIYEECAIGPFEIKDINFC